MWYNWGMAENKLLSLSCCRFVFQCQVKTPELPIQNPREPWSATVPPKAVYTAAEHSQTLTKLALMDSAQCMKTLRNSSISSFIHCQHPQVSRTNHPSAKHLLVHLGSNPAGLTPASLHGAAEAISLNQTGWVQKEKGSNTLTPATFLKLITSTWQKKILSVW